MEVEILPPRQYWGLIIRLSAGDKSAAHVHEDKRKVAVLADYLANILKIVPKEL